LLDPLLLSFVAVAALITITPGADMALVAATTLRHGKRAAWVTTLGVCSGLAVHATLSALGISVLLATSTLAFDALKLAGAAYLLFLGSRGLWHAWRTRTVPELPAAPALSPRGAFVRGLLNNLLNPKIAVFYLAFLPQFIEPGQDPLARSLLLAAVHICMGLAWLRGYAGFVARVGDKLRTPRIHARVEALTGSVLVLFGVRLLLERGPART
jgi:threonine/homoserine/homoserine lactone efflux protein